jgi:hypothetical protein
LIRLTKQACSELREDEALVFDWHRMAICCAVAGDVSLRTARRERLTASRSFRALESEPPGRIFAHRLAFPHLARRDVRIDCRRRMGMRRFTSDLPPDFGLRAVLGRA